MFKIGKTKGWMRVGGGGDKISLSLSLVLKAHVPGPSRIRSGASDWFRDGA